MIIKELMKSEYDRYHLHFTYQSSFYYDVITTIKEDTIQVVYQKKQFDQPVIKQFDATLFEPYYEHPKAFGIFEEDSLVGVVEINLEVWNKRIRITELLVLPAYRGKGYGKRLMQIVKDYFYQTDYRAIVLETQSCNDAAISFYFKEGFSIIGHDLICYTNDDVANNEVRLEFAYLTKPSLTNEVKT